MFLVSLQMFGQYVDRCNVQYEIFAYRLILYFINSLLLYLSGGTVSLPTDEVNLFLDSQRVTRNLLGWAGLRPPIGVSMFLVSCIALFLPR